MSEDVRQYSLYVNNTLREAEWKYRHMNVSLESTTSISISEEGLVDWIKDKVAKIKQKFVILANKIVARFSKNRAKLEANIAKYKANPKAKVELAISPKTLANIVRVSSLVLIAIATIVALKKRGDQVHRIKDISKKADEAIAATNKMISQSKAANAPYSTTAREAQKSLESIKKTSEEMAKRIHADATASSVGPTASDFSALREHLKKDAAANKALAEISNKVATMQGVAAENPKNDLDSFEYQKADTIRRLDKAIEHITGFEKNPNVKLGHQSERDDKELVAKAEAVRAKASKIWAKCLNELKHQQTLVSSAKDMGDIAKAKDTIKYHLEKAERDEGFCRVELDEVIDQHAVDKKLSFKNSKDGKAGEVLISKFVNVVDRNWKPQIENFLKRSPLSSVRFNDPDKVKVVKEYREAIKASSVNYLHNLDNFKSGIRGLQSLDAIKHHTKHCEEMFNDYVAHLERHVSRYQKAIEDLDDKIDDRKRTFLYLLDDKIKYCLEQSVRVSLQIADRYAKSSEVKKLKRLGEQELRGSLDALGDSLKDIKRRVKEANSLSELEVLGDTVDKLEKKRHTEASELRYKFYETIKNKG